MSAKPGKRGAVSQKIVGPIVAERLHPHTLKFVPIGDENIVIDTRPEELVTWQRLDIMAKYIYARHRDLQLDCDWAFRLYDKHLLAFNQYREGKGDEKNGLDEFVHTFHGILDSIRARGFDEELSLIPLGRGKVIIDGSHRVAACLLYDHKVTGLQVDVGAREYDYRFFKERGLASNWRDAMALEYSRLKPDMRVVLQYPSAMGRSNDVVQMLQASGSIAFEKEIILESRGQLNLVRTVYRGSDWLGDARNGYAGARKKADACFSRNGPLRAYFYEPKDHSALPKLKHRLRDLYRIGNHSIHISDTSSETIRMAQSFLNTNSIHFLNNAIPAQYTWFNHLFTRYRERIQENGRSQEMFCIDGSAVLAAYGIREARDIDFLVGGEGEPVDLEPGIGCHNNEASHYNHSLDEIIFDPENHFYFEGVKFASLRRVMQMKENRGEDKDLADQTLIKQSVPSLGFSSRILPLNVRVPNYTKLYWRMRIREALPSPVLRILRSGKRILVALIGSARGLKGG